MHTASHPGVSETLKPEYTHTEALIEMLFVLWDYGIPSISFTLLPRSWIFADDDGRVAAWHPDAKAAA